MAVQKIELKEGGGWMDEQDERKFLSSCWQDVQG